VPDGTAAEQLAHLKGYVASLPITAGVRYALRVKLENAAACYENRQNEQAVSMLSEVESLPSDGVLNTQQARDLTGAGTAVIDTHPTS
jgi:hypothetical protein